MKINLKCIFLLTTTLFLLQELVAQKKERPPFQRKFSHEIEKEKKEGKLRLASSSYWYTYIGNDQKARAVYDFPSVWGLDTLTTKDSLELAGYKPVPAKEYLEKHISEEQLVIIAEAHQKPEHRVFTAELLQELYDNGFRYLGMEAIIAYLADSTLYIGEEASIPPLTNNTQFLRDTALNARGYPLDGFTTGGYTVEPQMANIIRKALEIGFEIFAYERKSKGLDRDLQQALNVEHFMAAHPNSKMVLHCGWYHAIESDLPKFRTDNYMAHHIKKRTGIDPLTIYLDALVEKQPCPESPYYKLVESDEVSVLVNDKGEPFGGFTGRKHFDMMVYYPRTTYTNGRPDYLLTSNRKFVKVKHKNIDSYPVLIEALPICEQDGVPVDIIELTSKKDKKRLVLEQGQYCIRVTDVKRNKSYYAQLVE